MPSWNDISRMSALDFVIMSKNLIIYVDKLLIDSKQIYSMEHPVLVKGIFKMITSYIVKMVNLKKAIVYISDHKQA